MPSASIRICRANCNNANATMQWRYWKQKIKNFCTIAVSHAQSNVIHQIYHYNRKKMVSAAVGYDSIRVLYNFIIVHGTKQNVHLKWSSHHVHQFKFAARTVTMQWPHWKKKNVFPTLFIPHWNAHDFCQFSTYSRGRQAFTCWNIANAISPMQHSCGLHSSVTEARSLPHRSVQYFHSDARFSIDL